MIQEMSKKKKIGLMVFLVLVWLGLQAGIVMCDRYGIRGYNGVLTAAQFAVCLLAVWINYKVGTAISIILIGFSMINMLVVMIVTRKMDPLPGFCNLAIYTVTLLLLCVQFRIREKTAVTDFLTGLQNRRGLYQELNAGIEKGKPFYVIYIDLDNFKVINDNYGHTYGDSLLQLVTKRMKEIVGNRGVLSRIGGDEFVLVVDGEMNAAEIAERILDKICEKATLAANFTWIDSYLTAYAGISRFPEDSLDAEALIKYADIAMYQASKENKTRICFFNRTMEEHLKREVELERLIKDALTKDYFYLVYQPQYKLGDKKLRGFEALLRMRTPKGEFVSPAEFIPVAEKGDLILQIDDYVLRRAMKEFKDIVEQVEEELTISVNVSAKNISAKGFANKVKAILEETGFPSANLEIEITEYCMVQSVEATIQNIVELRALGIQVALDDFGTGYTSLSYLAKMPINLLKVDKSLVDDIVANEKSRDFVTAVIAMGHLMGCEVISEGVENEEQLALLNGQECDFVQGYVWGKPLDYEVARDIALSAS